MLLLWALLRSLMNRENERRCRLKGKRAWLVREKRAGKTEGSGSLPEKVREKVER